MVLVFLVEELMDIDLRLRLGDSGFDWWGFWICWVWDSFGVCVRLICWYVRVEGCFVESYCGGILF